MMARLSKILSTHSLQGRLYLQARCPYLVLGADPWAPVRHGSVWAVTGTKRFVVEGVSPEVWFGWLGGQVEICKRFSTKNAENFDAQTFCFCEKLSVVLW